MCEPGFHTDSNVRFVSFNRTKNKKWGLFSLIDWKFMSIFFQGTVRFDNIGYRISLSGVYVNAGMKLSVRESNELNRLSDAKELRSCEDSRELFMLLHLVQ